MEPFTPTRVQLESLTSEVENYFEKKIQVLFLLSDIVLSILSCALELGLDEWRPLYQLEYFRSITAPTLCQRVVGTQ